MTESTGSPAGVGCGAEAEPTSVAISDAAFALSVSTVSEPVETKFGFHVLERTP